MGSFYFTDKEIECPCCGLNNADQRTLVKLDNARIKAGIPFTITSGCRCEDHNKAVDGSKESSHLRGLAFDIRTNDSHSRSIIIQALLHAGFTRIGVAKGFIHVDNDFTKVQEVIWTY